MTQVLTQDSKAPFALVKDVLDFSEVPSDILPLIVAFIARLVFSVQQWVEESERNPMAIFCDEAHLLCAGA